MNGDNKLEKIIAGDFPVLHSTTKRATNLGQLAQLHLPQHRHDGRNDRSGCDQLKLAASAVIDVSVDVGVVVVIGPSAAKLCSSPVVVVATDAKPASASGFAAASSRLWPKSAAGKYWLGLTVETFKAARAEFLSFELRLIRFSWLSL